MTLNSQKVKLSFFSDTLGERARKLFRAFFVTPRFKRSNSEFINKIGFFRKMVLNITVLRICQSEKCNYKPFMQHDTKQNEKG